MHAVLCGWMHRATQATYTAHPASQPGGSVGPKRTLSSPTPCSGMYPVALAASQPWPWPCLASALRTPGLGLGPACSTAHHALASCGSAAAVCVHHTGKHCARQHSSCSSSSCCRHSYTPHTPHPTAHTPRPGQQSASCAAGCRTSRLWRRRVVHAARQHPGRSSDTHIRCRWDRQGGATTDRSCARPAWPPYRTRARRTATCNGGQVEAEHVGVRKQLLIAANTPRRRPAPPRPHTSLYPHPQFPCPPPHPPLPPLPRRSSPPAAPRRPSLRLHWPRRPLFPPSKPQIEPRPAHTRAPSPVSSLPRSHPPHPHLPPPSRWAPGTGRAVAARSSRWGGLVGAPETVVKPGGTGRGTQCKCGRLKASGTRAQMMQRLQLRRPSLPPLLATHRLPAPTSQCPSLQQAPGPVPPPRTTSAHAR